jgi:phosphoribosylanthranilate isomerase
MTEIKICGITNVPDALLASGYGANAVGFIFYPKSPRYVKPETAKRIIRRIPKGTKKVGVFVNESPPRVKELVEFCGLDLIQLHGSESPEYCRQFPSSLLIKAFSPRTEKDLGKLRAYPVRAILVDAHDPVLLGGIGKRSDWGLAAKVRESHLLILAGGLHVGNIREAIDVVSPHAVDINSGVENSPGRKNPEQVRAIIEILRGMGGEERSIFRSSAH